MSSAITLDPDTITSLPSPRFRKLSNSRPQPFNPCHGCGACCSHFRVSFYSGELEGETGGWVPVSLVTQVGPLRAAMKGTEDGGGRCIGLKGDLGLSNVRCGIYELRPSVCRDYEPYNERGEPNPDCQRLRTAIGLSLLDDLSGRDLAA
ncbi:YkgJ family cysteine cluster protein [Paenalcaligenes niemegkensis]|uniref:YkgJ family cysteine cluster protein n=1 Tax=Paenalcaligenes niemegkensis TaxID=2895469 RepID=UPI001EE81447|nr:YkgJ family cysteine cluster protein [Paenalcaligenes niemegkensis]MCQ9616504.1 YkgJ family cysteine cluster protein [Paenalcaligenes niemegkensis]